MCHPGYIDQELLEKSKYIEKRKLELDVFLDPELPKLLKANNITLYQ